MHRETVAQMFHCFGHGVDMSRCAGHRLRQHPTAHVKDTGRDIAAFAQKYPRIQLSLEFTDERRNLIKDGFDIAIRMAPNRNRAPNRKSLFSITRSIVASRSASMAGTILAPVGGCMRIMKSRPIKMVKPWR